MVRIALVRHTERATHRPQARHRSPSIWGALLAPDVRLTANPFQALILRSWLPACLTGSIGMGLTAHLLLTREPSLSFNGCCRSHAGRSDYLPEIWVSGLSGDPDPLNVSAHAPVRLEVAALVHL